MTTDNLVFKAGPGAFESIRRHGFAPERIGTLAGASGGAKCLVLSQLDRCILKTIVPKLIGPVHLIGSSIGSWRFACYAQDDPLAAIDRFEEAYISQSYSEKPDIHEITAKTREILQVVMQGGAAEQILRLEAAHHVFLPLLLCKLDEIVLVVHANELAESFLAPDDEWNVVMDGRLNREGHDTGVGVPGQIANLLKHVPGNTFSRARRCSIANEVAIEFLN